MKSFIEAVRRFAQDEEGVTAIEYGLIAAVIAGIVVVAFTSLGDELKGAFTKIGTTIKNAVPAGTP